jgi:uncharacterized protein YndB with AHSA1/START domain
MAAERTPDTVYITYINATPEKVWEALTSSAFTTQYFFGMRIESDWRPGSPWALYGPDGKRTVHGTVVEADRSRRLKVIWAVDGLAEPLPDCDVTYDIEPMGAVVKLTMTEHHPAPLDPKWLEGGRQGWPKILSGLKTLLETGKPLPMSAQKATD